MANKKPALVEGKKYVITGTDGEHKLPEQQGVKYPQTVKCIKSDSNAFLYFFVKSNSGMSYWDAAWFDYHEAEPTKADTTKVRIKPYRGGFRFEITYPNGKKPNHVYNTKAAAKKGLKDLAEALTNYEIVK